MKIKFYRAEETSRYESTGFMYKSADANFADTWCSTGGSYVRKVRWVQCHPSIATHFKGDAPAAKITKMVGDSEYRFPIQRAEPMTVNFRKWAAKAVPSGKTSIDYFTLCKGGLRGVPKFIKGAMLAFFMEAHRKHTDQQYLDKWYPRAVMESLSQQVTLLYLEEESYLPELE